MTKTNQTSDRLRKTGFLPTSDASNFFGVSDSTLRDRARDGRLNKTYDNKGMAYYKTFYTSSELALRLNVSPSTVRRMASRGEIIMKEVNGVRLYRTNS